MIIEPSEPNQEHQPSKIQQFLAQVNNYSFQLPADYKFNRDEIKVIE